LRARVKTTGDAVQSVAQILAQTRTKLDEVRGLRGLLLGDNAGCDNQPGIAGTNDIGGQRFWLSVVITAFVFLRTWRLS
jgi:hypothetical protein